MSEKPFPVFNSTTSFWRSQDLHGLDDHRNSTWPKESDVVIIGAGYAGASLVYNLLEKIETSKAQLSITIFEAREACSGATRRNGGHLKPDPFSRAGDVIDEHLKEAAEEVSSFEIRHMKEIGDLVKREDIDCDFVVTRATDACLYEKANVELKAKLDRLSKEGLSIVDDVFYSSEKTAEGVSGIKEAKGCFTHTAAHVWLYKLVVHLLDKAVKSGVNLQTYTPVTFVSEQPDADGCWAITTPRDSVKAKTIIHATNAYSSALIPELKDKIVPVKDGSIVVGGARRDYYTDLGSWYNVYDDSTLIESAKNYFDGYMQRHFIGWEDSGAYTDKVWTGIMDYSCDGFPFIGKLPGKPSQYVCAGFSGHGMPQVFLSAKAIASMVVDGTMVEDTDLPRLYRLTKERLESKKLHVSLASYDANMKALKATHTNGAGA